jgi:virginiamycin B lyase
MLPLRYRVVTSVLLLSLWACSGPNLASGPTTLPPAAGEARQNQEHHARVAVRLRVPARHHSHNPRLRHQDFIAASTRAIQLLVYRANSTHTPATLIETLVGDASATNTKDCTSNPDGSRNCTFTFGIPAPADDIVFSTFDQAPASGAIPSGAKQLAAAAIVDQKISIGKLNTISVTLGGIVASVQLQLPNQTSSTPVPTQSIHGTSASQWNVGFVALDADGNVILTDQFADANGVPQPVSVALAFPAGCGSGTIQSGASGTPGTTLSIAAPQSTAIVFAYGATALAGLIGATPCTFALTASAVTTIGASDFTLSGPKITEYPSSINAPKYMSAGNDGNVWFVSSVAAKAGQFSLQTHAVAITTGVSATSGIAPGPSSATNLEMWTAGTTGIQDMLSAGGSAAGAPFAGPSFVGPANGIALGNDQNEWFTDCGSNSIGKITSSGTITEYPVESPASALVGITSGPDGELWYTESATKKIGRIGTDGGIGAEVSTGGLVPGAIAAGNGLLWIVDGSVVESVTTQGALTTYSVSNANFVALAAGPDNAMWVTDDANNSIARVPFGATSSSQVTEYKIPTSTAFVIGIALGADGNIYFAEEGANQIGELSL